MTEQQEAPVPPGTDESAAIVVTARKGTKLEQLHALYFELQAEKSEVEKRFKAVCDAIKVEVTSTDAGSRRFELHGPKGGDRPALRVTYTESRRFDSTRFRKEHPDIYPNFLKTSVSWGIRAAADSGGE